MPLKMSAREITTYIDAWARKKPKRPLRKTRAPSCPQEKMGKRFQVVNGFKLSFWMPLQLVSEMNKREHWRERNKRKKQQQAAVYTEMYLNQNIIPKLPLLVTLTRIGPRLFDPDNNVASFKHVQDQIAKSLGVDDGDRTMIRWQYSQRQEDFYAVRVAFEKLKGAELAEASP